MDFICYYVKNTIIIFYLLFFSEFLKCHIHQYFTVGTYWLLPRLNKFLLLFVVFVLTYYFSLYNSCNLTLITIQNIKNMFLSIKYILTNE